MIKLFKIKGDSLFPLYKEGQVVLCIKAKYSKLKVGDIVVFHHQDYGLMIKKIQEIKDDKFFVVGTTPSSIDSRNFGYILKENIYYKVLFNLWNST